RATAARQGSSLPSGAWRAFATYARLVGIDASAESILLEQLEQTLPRVIESDGGHIEPVRIERLPRRVGSSQPSRQRIVLRVGRVSHDPDQVLVPWRPTAILRRARSLPFQAPRVAHAGL